MRFIDSTYSVEDNTENSQENQCSYDSHQDNPPFNTPPNFLYLFDSCKRLLELEEMNYVDHLEDDNKKRLK